MPSLQALAYSPGRFRSRRSATNRDGPPAYLFENWKRALAPFWPYFLRSLVLGSRVSRPSFLSLTFASVSTARSALEIPCRTAPACPEEPPPTTDTSTSYLSTAPVTSKG